VGFLFAQLADVKKTQLAKTQEELEPQQRRAEQFRKAYGDLQKIRSEADQIVGYVDARYQWADILSELREVLIRVEATTKSKLRSDTGVWVERLNTIAARSDEPAAATAAVSEDDNPARSRAADLAFRRRYRLPIPGEGGGGDAAPEPEADNYKSPLAGGTAPAAGAPATTGPKKPKTVNTNELAVLNVTFRATSLSAVQADANKQIAFAVLGELQNSQLFDPDPDETKFSGSIGNEEAPGTFTFGVTLRLKRPVKL